MITDTLDSRRREILKILYGLRPFTLRSFQAMLDAAYGAGNVTLELKNDKYELWIDLTPNTTPKINGIYGLAESVVPKNLLIFFKTEKPIQALTHYMTMAKRIRLKVTIRPTTVSTESGTGTIYAGGVQAITETINYVQGAD